MDLKQLWDKYKDIIPYAFFGVCTTLVNVVSYWLFAHKLNQSVMFSTIIAWIFAVLFAYLTNKKWVFHSETNTTKMIAKEIISFFACRLATGIVDWFCMFVFVEKLGLYDVVIKFFTNVIVIIFNYVASKLFIFRNE